MSKTKCKCGQEISFIKSAKSGKLIPVNADKIEAVNGYLFDISRGEMLRDKEGSSLVLDDGTVVRVISNGMTGYMPHWATCKFAKDFRKGKS